MSKKKSLIKVILIGDSGYSSLPYNISISVGKTSLMQRFINRKFISQYKTTIGADFSSKDILIEDKATTLQVSVKNSSLGLGYRRPRALSKSRNSIL